MPASENVHEYIENVLVDEVNEMNEGNSAPLERVAV